MSAKSITIGELMVWRDEFLRTHSGNETLFVGVDFGNHRIASIRDPQCLAARDENGISGIILFTSNGNSANPIIVSIWTPRYKSIDEEIVKALLSGAIEEIEKKNTSKKIHVNKLFGPAWKYFPIIREFSEKIEIVGEKDVAALFEKLHSAVDETQDGE